MVSKEKRNEVWERNKPYMKYKDTTEDLLPICKKCECWSKDNDKEEWCEERAKCPVFQLWLSHEYLEWCNSYNY